MGTWFVLEEEEPEAARGLGICFLERPEGDEVVAHADGLHGGCEVGGIGGWTTFMVREELPVAILTIPSYSGPLWLSSVKNC